MSDQGNQAVTYELEQLQLSRNAEANSVRSRASSVVSSVVSTGTKFSISTLPQGTHHIDGMLEGSGSGSGSSQLNLNTTTRPASLYSVRSTATSLPPYEGHQNDSSLTLTSQDGHSPPAQGSPANGTDNAGQPLTPTRTDEENALSRHYGAIVRTIDEQHQRLLARTLQGHEQELATQREAIDKAYRKEFKAKDRDMERIREKAAAEIAALEEANKLKLEALREESTAKLAALEAQFLDLTVAHGEEIANLQQHAEEKTKEMNEKYEKGIEKACNAIEDVWEGRWNDRMKLDAEEGRRRVEKRDEEWLRVLQRDHPELVDDMKMAMGLSK